QFKCALITVVPHRRQPPGVNHSGTENPGGLFPQRPGAHLVRCGGIADVGLRLDAGEGAHGGDHAAVVLEVVVRVGDVVLAGVRILRGYRDPPIVGTHVFRRRLTVQVAPVGETAPRGVDLGEISVATPVTRVDQLEQACPVGTGGGTEDAPQRAFTVTVFREVA